VNVAALTSPASEATTNQISDGLTERVMQLAQLLRASGLDPSTVEVIDAIRALSMIDLTNKRLVADALRCVMVKQADPDDAFGRAFRQAFTFTDPAQRESTAAGEVASESRDATTPNAGELAQKVQQALSDSDRDALGVMAAQAVDALAGIGEVPGSERYFLHRTMRALDVSRMLAAGMMGLRADGQLSELEMTLARNDMAAMIEAFKRALAAEIALRLSAFDTDIVGALDPGNRLIVELGTNDLTELRRLVQPLARQLAARIGRRHRLRSTGRLDVRRTVRRSLNFGGVPLDVIAKRKHPHRPEIVLLCDVSGSMAEFAQFTLSLVNALHSELGRVRSFAFVDGMGEVTDLFGDGRYDIPVHRIVERSGVVRLDGHSDYGAAFDHFCDTALDAITARTTVIVAGDARSNYRNARTDRFGEISERARRVHWLNPDPIERWDVDDSITSTYRPFCSAMHQVSTLDQLAAAIDQIV
jgi:uncharacterized protein